MLLPRNPDGASLCTLPVSHPNFPWRSHAEFFLCDVNFTACFFSHYFFFCFHEDKGNSLVESTDFHRSQPARHHRIISNMHAAILSGQDLVLAARPPSPPHLAGAVAV